MRRDEAIRLLKAHGIQPSAQRVVVAERVLDSEAHPSADQLFAEVKRALPMISRATVYNTLNLLVERGLLRELVLTPGRAVFDPKLSPHHHFIDDRTGVIHDVPWDSVEVKRVEAVTVSGLTTRPQIRRKRNNSGSTRHFNSLARSATRLLTNSLVSRSASFARRSACF